MSVTTVPLFLRQKCQQMDQDQGVHIVIRQTSVGDQRVFLLGSREMDGPPSTTEAQMRPMTGTNYPDGVDFDDPRAPWNQDEKEYVPQDIVMDEIFCALREMELEPDYKEMNVIRFYGGEVTVKFNE